MNPMPKAQFMMRKAEDQRARFCGQHNMQSVHQLHETRGSMRDMKRFGYGIALDDKDRKLDTSQDSTDPGRRAKS